MKKVCFIGCSFTVGEGFPESQRDQFIYDRLLQKELDFHRDNLAVCGASNDLIFMITADALSKDYDVLFVQWSAFNRTWLYPGPDTKLFSNCDLDTPYHYRDIYLSHKEKKNFFDLLLLLNHDYHNIIKLIDYCSIIDRLSQYHGKKVIYINGLVPWTDDLLNTDIRNIETDLSSYTKALLDFENRDDAETLGFFRILQEKFQKLDKSKWVNLFDSFQSNVVDLGPEGHHPGIQSNKWMAKEIKKYISKHGILVA